MQINIFIILQLYHFTILGDDTVQNMSLHSTVTVGSYFFCLSYTPSMTHTNNFWMNCHEKVDAGIAQSGIIVEL